MRRRDDDERSRERARRRAEDLADLEEKRRRMQSGHDGQIHGLMRRHRNVSVVIALIMGGILVDPVAVVLIGAAAYATWVLIHDGLGAFRSQDDNR